MELLAGEKKTHQEYRRIEGAATADTIFPAILNRVNLNSFIASETCEVVARKI